MNVNKFGFHGLTNPPVAGWTQHNGADVSVEGNSRILRVPIAGAISLRVETRPIGASTIVEAGIVALGTLAQYSSNGLILRESSSGKMVNFYQAQDGRVGTDKFSSFAQWVDSYPSRPVNIAMGRPRVIRLVLDANRTYFVSIGGAFAELQQIAVADFFDVAADEVGWFGNVLNAPAVDVELFHWTQ